METVTQSFRSLIAKKKNQNASNGAQAKSDFFIVTRWKFLSEKSEQFFHVSHLSPITFRKKNLYQVPSPPHQCFLFLTNLPEPRTLQVPGYCGEKYNDAAQPHTQPLVSCERMGFL